MPTAKPRRNLFDPKSTEPFPLSRSGVESWISCPRCFWLHKRLGIRPPGPPAMMLNRAVDELLKREFDAYRARAVPHPLMQEHGIDAVPFRHPDLATWRSNFKGVRLLHKATNLMLYGAVDDIWVRPDGELVVADYKGTASAKPEPQTLDAEYRQSYRRQPEFYGFLLKGNGFKVSRRCFIVYAVGIMSAPSLDGKLSFRMELIEHMGDDSWIEPTLSKVKETLMLKEPPKPAPDCETCGHVAAVTAAVDKTAAKWQDQGA